jgi:uncharacterized protein
MEAAGAFEWDDNNTAHIARHDVTREEAESFFRHPRYEEQGDTVQGERRVWALGVTDQGRYLTLIYTVRGASVRVVTAHTAKRRYRSLYEKATGKD